MGLVSGTHRDVEILDPDDAAWARFVEAHPQATPFHHPAWVGLLADCYRFRGRVFALRRPDGELAAGFPVIELGRSQGRRWVALPFTDRCSPLMSPDVAADRLDERIHRARERLGLRSIEVRDRLSRGWAIPQGYWHELSLDRSAEELKAALHKTRAQQIRRAEREGIIVERGESRSDLCDVFYRLHVATRRRQGVPVQPRRFFSLLWERMLQPGHGFVLTARLGERAIASAVFLSFGGHVTYKFSASDRSPFGAPDAVLWKAIQLSCRDGAHRFDFGRTDTGNPGLRQFKLWWGTREETLAYTIFGSRPPVAGRGRSAAALAPLIRRAPPWVAQGIGALAYRFTA